MEKERSRDAIRDQILEELMSQMYGEDFLYADFDDEECMAEFEEKKKKFWECYPLEEIERRVDEYMKTIK